MRRSLLIGACAIALALASMGAVTLSARAQTVPAPPTGGGHDLSSGAAQDCKHMATRVTALHRDGTEAAPGQGDGQGRAYHFTDPQLGDLGYEPVAPPQFDPMNASDQELKVFGFETRPAVAGPALDHWRSLYGNYHPDSNYVPFACRRNNANYWVTTTDHGWSGAVNNAPPPEGYWQTQVGFRQTAWDAVCPGASAYSTWSGIGGWYDGGTGKAFAQTGTNASQSILSGTYEWWEAMSRDIDTREVQFGPHAPPSGDEVYASVNFDRPSDTITFRVIDSDPTTGHVKSSDPFVFTGATSAQTGIHEDALAFYNASSAEYITEQPVRLDQNGNPNGPAPGGRYYLRKPHLQNTWVNWAKADMNDMEAFGRFGVDQLSENNSHYVQNIETTVGAPGWTGTHSFYDEWIWNYLTPCY